MKILVVGNGSTGVDSETKKSYINNHTGSFLNGLSCSYQIGFLQSTTVYNHNLNLQNFDISSSILANHNLPNKKHPLFLVKLIRYILQYDFIYIFYPGTLGTIVGILSRILKKPYALYVRGEYFNKNQFDNIVLYGSQFILTISPSFTPKLKHFCNNVEVIKPMISITEKDLIKNRNYYKYDTIKLLFVGRIEEEKGIYELIEIALRLKKQNINYLLDIVGGGDLYNEVLDLINEKGLIQHVFLHGQISDFKKLKYLYDNATTFVFPTHHEGFPRVLYEAMASGLPIFTTFVGGITGRMKHLENCIEIPVKNGPLASKIILKFIKDKTTMERIGKKCLETMNYILGDELLSHENLFIKYINNEK
jgi:glycosyltransferase involved in cell wall biosynthesis